MSCSVSVDGWSVGSDAIADDSAPDWSSSVAVYCTPEVWMLAEMSFSS